MVNRAQDEPPTNKAATGPKRSHAYFPTSQALRLRRGCSELSGHCPQAGPYESSHRDRWVPRRVVVDRARRRRDDLDHPSRAGTQPVTDRRDTVAGRADREHPRPGGAAEFHPGRQIQHGRAEPPERGLCAPVDCREPRARPRGGRGRQAAGEHGRRRRIRLRHTPDRVRVLLLFFGDDEPGAQPVHGPDRRQPHEGRDCARALRDTAADGAGPAADRGRAGPVRGRAGEVVGTSQPTRGGGDEGNPRPGAGSARSRGRTGRHPGGSAGGGGGGAGGQCRAAATSSSSGGGGGHRRRRGRRRVQRRGGHERCQPGGQCDCDRPRGRVVPGRLRRDGCSAGCRLAVGRALRLRQRAARRRLRLLGPRPMGLGAGGCVHRADDRDGVALSDTRAAERPTTRRPALLLQPGRRRPGGPRRHVHRIGALRDRAR